MTAKFKGEEQISECLSSKRTKTSLQNKSEVDTSVSFEMSRSFLISEFISPQNDQEKQQINFQNKQKIHKNTINKLILDKQATYISQRQQQFLITKECRNIRSASQLADLSLQIKSNYIKSEKYNNKQDYVNQINSLKIQLSTTQIHNAQLIIEKNELEKTVINLQKILNQNFLKNEKKNVEQDSQMEILKSLEIDFAQFQSETQQELELKDYNCRHLENIVKMQKEEIENMIKEKHYLGLVQNYYPNKIKKIQKFCDCIIDMWQKCNDIKNPGSEINYKEVWKWIKLVLDDYYSIKNQFRNKQLTTLCTEQQF